MGDDSGATRRDFLARPRGDLSQRERRMMHTSTAALVGKAGMRRLAVLIGLLMAIGAAMVGALPAAAQTVVYSNDFSGSIGLEWSANAAIVDTPSGERVLGSRTFGSPRPVSGTEALTLTLAGLPAHSQMTLSVDLYTLRSWDGNRTDFGPDFWDLDATGTAPDIQPRTTFSNYVEVQQSYPDAFPGANPGTTGAAATGDLLGFGTSGNSEIPAVRYRLSYSFAHTDASVIFSFAGENLQFWGDEGWVLDNVVVSVTSACPPNDDEDGDGLTDANENILLTLLGNADSDLDGVADGNDDANGNREDDEDEDDDDCPDEDSDDDGEDDEDEDDEDDDD
jgi:hypothetical protein